MLASYVLDPGRRSHGLDVLALEFLDHAMTSYEDLCGAGRTQLPFDVVPVEAARDYSCEDADMTLRLRRHFEPQLEAAGLAELFRTMEVPLVGVLADMEAAASPSTSPTSRRCASGSRRSASGWSARSTRRRASSSTSTRTCSSGRCCSRSCSCR
jgi:hypothetical protein